MDQYTKIKPLSSDQGYIRKIITQIFGNLTDQQFDALFPLFDWIQIQAGKQLIRQGEDSNDLFFLVYGRLTAIHENQSGESRILGEILPGQAVGETGVIAGQPRMAHVFAARDSVMIRLSKEMLYELGHQFPVLILNVARTIIRRTEQNTKPSQQPKHKNIVFLTKEETSLQSRFFETIHGKLQIFGKISFLDLESISQKLGISKNDFASLKEDSALVFRLQKILDEIENSSDFVIFRVHENEPLWVTMAIAQADAFYILKDFDESEELTPTEEKLFSNHLKYQLTKKNLVLLHPNGDQLPVNTLRFLKNRSLQLHHHIRLDRDSDLERLARFITGNAIGIALSGGGAKGLAHVGIILGLREKGIPIDFFSGTSVGTFITALGSLDITSEEFYEWGKVLAKKAPTRRKNMNIAPLISLMKGKHLDEFLNQHIGKYNIEDAWINSIYVASNLTEKKKVVLRTGRMSFAIRASIALPGIFPPAVSDNSLVVDGGIFENLPIESLEDFPVGKKIAVTVHSTKKYKLEYEVVPESWEILRDRYFGKRKFKVPPISTIIMESMILASSSKYEEFLEKADLHLHPPINRIGLMEWDSYKEMVEIGRNYTDEMITDSIRLQLMPYMAKTTVTPHTPPPHESLENDRI